VAGVLVGGVSPAATADPILDTHTHFYDPGRPEGVPWPGRGDKTLYRAVLPQHFRELAAPLGVTGTVVVEASPWVEDNQWLLDLAAQNRDLLGIVGNLNPGTETFAALLKRFAANPLYRGIRISSSAIRTGLERPAFLQDLRRLAEADLELDVNGGPELLSLTDALARLIPELRMVVNHLSNVRIDSPQLNPDWVAGVKAVAARPRTFMKVSALVESASRDGKPAPRDPEYYFPVLETVWKAFGEDRLVFGSNWPVSERAGSYETILQIVRAFFSTRGPAATRKFFSENARAAYKLSTR